MSRETNWANQDGLSVGFGTHSVDNGALAAHGVQGAVQTATMRIVGLDLEDSDSVTVASPGFGGGRAILIPRGSYITRATLVTTVVFTGSSSTLDIGTYSAAAVVDDADGIDVDIVLTAIDAIGETVVCNGALIGGAVPVGATSNSDVVVIAAYQTSAFTAGEAILTVEWIAPSEASASLAA